MTRNFDTRRHRPTVRGSWYALFYVALAAFTAFVLWDTFLFARVYVVVDDAAATTPPTTASATADPTVDAAVTPVVTDTTYDDAAVSVTLTEYREYDTAIYVADVTVTDTSVLRTAFAQGAFGRNVTATTSTIAADNSAVVAINGDFYGARSSGYVLRNGVAYRDTAVADQEDLVIYQDGTMSIVNESEISLAQLEEAGAWQVLSFGPGLVSNGQVVVGSDDEVDKAMVSNPRTAIGQVGENHYVLVVSDGRTEESAGLTLQQLAEFMQGLGVQTAYNLDGGGSSTMYFNGVVVNNPTTSGNSIEERSVSDIVYVAP